ncbi:MAG: TVP38/TMEM64 family protein [Clostridia bacterium]|nr:TVP38/TMEM64 family protein [Clostridia bacterium]MBQ8399532.1 TVP38/TMEM64 family protein [Clostridia bacterium]
MKGKILKFTALGSFIAAVILAAVFFYPYLKDLRFDVTEEWLVQVKGKLDRFGVFKYLIVLMVQVLQVLLAFIPGEPVEILAGYMCGTLGGLAIALLGVALGTSVIYLAVMKWGRRLVDKVADSKAYEKMRFLHKSASRDGLLFLLFFIPGTPKDFLTYFAPLLKIKLTRLLLIVLVARIPSVISSTYLGATLSKGDLSFSILIFALTAAVGAAGIIVNDLLLEQKKKM